MMAWDLGGNGALNEKDGISGMTDGNLELSPRKSPHSDSQYCFAARWCRAGGVGGMLRRYGRAVAPVRLRGVVVITAGNLVVTTKFITANLLCSAVPSVS